jgi:hypothetical protein
MVPPGVFLDFIGLMIRIDADPIPTSEILALYPDAFIPQDQPFVQPEVFGFVFDNGASLLADGEIHSIVSSAVLPPIDSPDEGSGYLLTDFVDPPYLVVEPPNLVADIEVDGQRWFIDTRGNCGVQDHFDGP